MQAWITQLRKGLVELCVMQLLDTNEAYGYQILQQLNRVEGPHAESDLIDPSTPSPSQNRAAGFELTESTLYPLLARLARDGLVKVRTAPSPAGPPRRYYRLSAAGKARLNEMTTHWTEVRDAVDHLLNGNSSSNIPDFAAKT
jgi:PadR family transcriptional regulator PadR